MSGRQNGGQCAPRSVYLPVSLYVARQAIVSSVLLVEEQFVLVCVQCLWVDPSEEMTAIKHLASGTIIDNPMAQLTS